jgi:signal transduction histidine kinase
VADRWWRRGSVRTRTTLLATVVSGTALVLGSGLLLLTLDRSLHAAGDDLARGRVRDLAVQATRGELPGSLSGIRGEGVGQVFDEDGTVLTASPNVTGRPPVFRGTAPTGAPVLRILRGAPDDDESENYRVWVQRVSTRDGPVTVLAGASLESVSEASRMLRTDLAYGVPLLVGLVALGTWLVIGRTLRPVEDIRTEVAAIGDDRLDRRVPVPGADDEIGRLAVTMNQMLARLEDASRRQRNFVADASHELQSPIGSLRAQLEVALVQPDNDWPALTRGLLRDTDQMERLVADLLFLAQSSSGVRERRTDLVDLDDVVLEEAARARSLTDAAVDTSAVSAAPVTGNADELRRLVRNLVENAVRHAGGRIRLALVLDDTRVRLDVADDGPGLADADRERVFDRFTRLDGARSRSTGTGLGLAIAREIAERHAGTLTAVASDSGAHFVLLLPVGEQPVTGVSPSTPRSVDRPMGRT